MTGAQVIRIAGKVCNADILEARASRAIWKHVPLNTMV